MGLSAYCQTFAQLLIDQLIITDRQGNPLSNGSAGVLTRLEAVRAMKGKVILIGNGGSAALVAHMHNDLMKCDGIRAMLCTDVSLLTAYTNDDGYDTAYAQQIRTWGDAGDVLIAVSSSGRSENILNGVAAARARSMQVITLSGFDAENPLRRLGDINFYLASHQYGYVEMGHGVICHYLTDSLKQHRQAGALI